MDLKTLAVILDIGREQAQRDGAEALARALDRMAEQAVSLAVRPSEVDNLFQDLRDHYGF